jgi:hypothetical protein
MGNGDKASSKVKTVLDAQPEIGMYPFDFRFDDWNDWNYWTLAFPGLIDWQ